MIAADDMILAPVPDVQLIHGVQFPKETKFRQFLITGPPGAGKSTLVANLRGWPYEAYIDLAIPNWWMTRELTFRPREIHLGAPFEGHRQTLTVVDDEWAASFKSLKMDFGRIAIPPQKDWLLGVNWRRRYTFEFILPPAEEIYEDRRRRAKTGLFPHDVDITLELVQAQIDFYRTIAWYFWLSDMNVYVRTERDGRPQKIIECRKAPPPVAPPKKNWLDRIDLRLRGRRDGAIVRAGPEPMLLDGPCRIAWSTAPFQMRLGGVAFELHPDRPFTGGSRGDKREWIIHPGSSFYGDVPRFARIPNGGSIVLGDSKPGYRNMFGFNSSVAERHVRITNRRGELKVKPLDLAYGTSISTLIPPRAAWVARHENLMRVRQMLGRPLAAYETDEALTTVRKVNAIIAHEAWREKDDEGRPGGILQFPDDATVILLGDTHAQIDNVLRLLSEGGTLAALERGEAFLAFLGDMVHSEEDGEEEEMEPTLLMLDFFCMLKMRFPKNVFYIRGNHETFSYKMSKSGVPQGLLLRKHLEKRRGAEYAQEIEKLFDGLAFIVQGNGFAACHGAPVRSHVDRSALVNIRRFPGLQHEVLWNRLRQPNRPAGYFKGSVRRFRETLGLPKRAPIIVGHTPLSITDTVWWDAGGIKGHHVIYSAYTHRFAAMVVKDGRATPLEFVPEPALDYLQRTEVEPANR